MSDYAFPATSVGIGESLTQRINQELTHLSYSRTARQDDNSNWVREPMARALLTRCAAFAAHLLSDSSRHLLTQNTKARFEQIQRLIEELLRAPKA